MAICFYREDIKLVNNRTNKREPIFYQGLESYLGNYILVVNSSFEIAADDHIKRIICSDGLIKTFVYRCAEWFWWYRSHNVIGCLLMPYLWCCNSLRRYLQPFLPRSHQRVMPRMRSKPRRQHKREKFDIHFWTIPTDHVKNWPEFIPHPIQIKIYRTWRRVVQTKRL